MELNTTYQTVEGIYIESQRPPNCLGIPEVPSWYECTEGVCEINEDAIDFETNPELLDSIPQNLTVGMRHLKESQNVFSTDDSTKASEKEIPTCDKDQIEQDQFEKCVVNDQTLSLEAVKEQVSDSQYSGNDSFSIQNTHQLMYTRENNS